MTNENQDNVGRFYMQEDLTIAHVYKLGILLKGYKNTNTNFLPYDLSKILPDPIDINSRKKNLFLMLQ